MPPCEDVSVEAFASMRANRAGYQLLDVREPWELALCGLAEATAIPMSQVPERIGELATDKPLVICCHHGMRSLEVTRWLRRQGFDNALNLTGGLDLWAKSVDPDMPTY